MIERREAIAHLLKDRPDDLLVITGLGSPTYDVAAADDVAENFYLWGAMGGAAAMALGLAQARTDKRVVVITGDGEMLMGMGSLATIGARQPENLAIVVIDNEAFGETGGQPSHTGLSTNLAAVALACGFRKVMTVRNASELDDVRALVHGGKGAGACRAQDQCEGLAPRAARTRWPCHPEPFQEGHCNLTVKGT
jgi:thiamine pyrophosphate-dependent acetolactate synthase large subunit-like protein